MNDSTTWWLTPLGYQPWTAVIDELHGLRCAWADYTGFHHDQLPHDLREPPPYSHVWGWSHDRLVRIRVDIDQGVIAVLTTAPRNAASHRVDTIERTALPFDKNHEPTRLVHVTGHAPLVFVAGPQGTP